MLDRDLIKLAKECKCELKWEGGIWNSGTDQFIYFVPFSFPNTKIGFGKENGHEVFFYIENNKNENAQKLNCFSDENVGRIDIYANCIPAG